MKHWGLVTVALYVALAVMLAFPLHQLCFNWGKTPLGASSAVAMIGHWGFWLWIGLSALCQAALLLVPVAVSAGRPVTRRTVFVPAITSAFLLALVCVSSILTVAAGIFGDRSERLYEMLGTEPEEVLLNIALYFALTWLLWGLVFSSFCKVDGDRDRFIARSTRWLLRGSILELLVAIPSHIAARQRNDCCAPIVTFWGIATGITVMLVAFGPGIYFLFVERWRRLHPKQRGNTGPNSGEKHLRQSALKK